MTYNLFLDDIRMPHDVGNYIYPVELRPLFRLQPWEIVRNYDEFVAKIIESEIPDLISFDHDLSDEHYDPSMYQGETEYNKNYERFKEKTGYDCAKWLIKYIIDNKFKMPEILCHSMNPVGKENILKLFENYARTI